MKGDAGGVIRNTRNRRVVCRACELAESSWAKARGLMLRESMSREQGMLMPFEGDQKPGIWMLFMRFPIDIVFISGECRVVDIVEEARPMGLSPRTWRVFRPREPAGYVLELPAGRVSETGLMRGDRLDMGSIFNPGNQD